MKNRLDEGNLKCFLVLLEYLHSVTSVLHAANNDGIVIYRNPSRSGNNGISHTVYPHPDWANANANEPLASSQPLCAYQRTVVWNKQEKGRKYWATRSFARTAHLFACSRQLASLVHSAALTCLLACSLCSLPRSWDREFNCYFFCVFFNFGP